VSERRPQDDDVEIDLGRHLRRLLRRWWIVAGCVVIAVAVAYLTRSGRTQTWTAKALVYLGQPFAPNGGVLPTTPSNNPLTPSLLVRQEEVLARAAQAAGLQPSQLRGHVTTQVASGGISPKGTYTPYVYITVQGPWKAKVAKAADALAQQILDLTNRYPKQRLAVIQKRIVAMQQEERLLRRRETDFENRLRQLQRQKASSTAEQILIQSTQATIISALNGITIRIGTIDDELATNLQVTALSRNIEQNQLVTRARAVRTTAGSAGANYGVAVILGLLIGVILALLSFALWQPRERTERAPRGASPASEP
jgi:hypothetical protein